MQNNNRVSLSYLFFTFLKIGAISWGGFMAMISVVRKQLVDKDKTVNDELILDGISLASVLPGPVAFNVVTFIGYSLRGIAGALVSMVAVILPSFILILGLASIYETYGHVAAFTNFFMGILPAISAVIISVAINLFQKQVKDYKQITICVLSCLTLLFIHAFVVSLCVIIAGASAGYFLYRESPAEKAIPAPQSSTSNIRKYIRPSLFGLTAILLLLLLPFLLNDWANEKYKLIQTLFFTFSGMSLTLFGGGYVIIPAMQQIIVDGYHWLSINEFADAIAMGQITPGPIFISATFIGYRIAGSAGALVATIAVFFPPGILMLICSRILIRIKQSKTVNAIFKGLRPAIIGMIFSAAFTLGKEAQPAWPTVLIFLTALVLLIKFKLDVVYLIPASGLAGILLYLL